MSYQTVDVDIGPPVATVSLDRVSSGNAVNERMAFELAEACRQLDQDEKIWVVIVTGRGRAFCQGTDSAALAASGSHLETLRSLKVADCIAAIGKPVVAALNGDAVGQGLELALACDILVASRAATFGLTQIKEGMMPWDGGTQRLPRLVGLGRAMEMVLTGRVLAAQEALDIGLVSQIAEAGETLRRAQEVASALAGNGPIAARYLKEAVLKGMDMTLDQGLRLEADLNFILQSTADRAEGSGSFLERRKPQYQGQ